MNTYDSEYGFPLLLGHIADSQYNEAATCDLERASHILITGESVANNTRLLQIIMSGVVSNKTPAEYKMLVINGAGTNAYTAWANVPHLVTPIIDGDMDVALCALRWLVSEIDNRHARLAASSTRDIYIFNAWARERRDAGEHVTHDVLCTFDGVNGGLAYVSEDVDLSPMPHIVVIMDEYSDLMAAYPEMAEYLIDRILTRGTAVGVHLILATPRVFGHVIPGRIKAGITTRISFQLPNVMLSRAVLGCDGAAELKPNQIIITSPHHAPIRANILDEGRGDLDDCAARACKYHGAPQFVDVVVDNVFGDMSAPNKWFDMALYKQACDIVLTDRKASVAYLQRKLLIGYNKACALIEQMTKDGIISNPDANGRRQILKG